MNMFKRTGEKLWLLSWLSLAVCPGLAAEEIYHWVDADGVSHYSQSPPPAESGEVSTLNVDGSQPASYDPNEDRYNVAAQQEAMQAKRDEMAENRKNRQQAAPAGDNTVIYYPQEEDYDEIVYPPGYWGERPDWPGNRPRPPHRPVQPLPDPVPPSNSKPFRPVRP
jgi:hypothetical protein